MTELLQDQAEHPPIADLTAEIVGAYVAHHTVAPADLPTLIMTVGRQLAGLGREPIMQEEKKPKPAVPVKRSVTADGLICLVCGQSQKILKRHLATRHDLSPEAYRAMFGLRDDYPLVAPAYAAMRSTMAKKIGLGSRPEPPTMSTSKKAPRKRTAKKPAAKKGRTQTK